MNRKLAQRIVVSFLALNLAFAWGVQTASAAMIGTHDAIQSDQRAELIADVKAQMSRDAVRSQFIELGVSPDAVESRLDQLTDEELVSISDRLDEMPAGSGIAGALGIVLVVLLVLELLGITNVFTRL